MDAVNKNGAKAHRPGNAAKRNPERTREQILDAARTEFAEKGLEGARVDEIARRAGANKRMLYHYFGNKEDLFLAVLERAYAKIRRHENELNLKALDPIEGMSRLVGFTFSYFVENPYWISLLNSENLHRARHLKKSTAIRKMHSPLLDLIEDLLDRGQTAGVFRSGVDPVQLYISVASLSYFYFSNHNTLATIFARDLLADAALEERRRHVIDVILGYLRP
jgi:AcrR family transcriptional regulator